MSCAALVHVVGHICGGGQVTPLERRVRKWCFKCRRRQLHDRFLLTQEWYEPTVVIECPKCKGDYTQFGGW